MKKTMCRHLMTLTVAMMSALAVCSCSERSGREGDFVKYVDVEPAGWEADETVWFEPFETDSTLREGEQLELQIMLRQSERYNPRPVRLAIEIEDATGNAVTDTILAQENNPKYTEDVKNQYGIKETTWRRLRSIRLNEGLAIGVHPLSEPEGTKGVLSIGVRLVPEQ